MGDFRNVAGEREMGPLCGSLPQDAGDLAGLAVHIISVKTTVYKQHGSEILSNPSIDTIHNTLSLQSWKQIPNTNA